MAYKRDLDDLRESPAVKVAKLLLERGVVLSYHDPYIPQVDLDGKIYGSIGLTPEAVRDKDLVMITTDHSGVDYLVVVENARLIYDTRNALQGFNSGNIRKLGS